MGSPAPESSSGTPFIHSPSRTSHGPQGWLRPGHESTHRHILPVEVVAVRASDVVGEYGERLAVRHLEAKGLVVLQRRWRCSRGEIDIVAVDDGCLVVCEVKTRRSLGAGTPAEAVTPAKVARLRRLTALWLEQQEISWRDVRLDVVTVVLPRSGRACIEHLRGVG